MYGETRQNLWVNPTGTSEGVTATANADGSLKLSGTSTIYSRIELETHALKKGSTYTISLSASLPEGASVRVRLYRGIANNFVDDACLVSSAGDHTFTLPDDGSYDMEKFAVVVSSGVTVDATIRIMLNEGDAPAPWSPPGLASVESVEVVACGGNLLPPFPKSSMGTYNGVTFSESEDGFIKISGSNIYDTGVTLPDTGPEHHSCKRESMY